MAMKWWWKKHRIEEDEYVIRNKQFFVSKRIYDFIINDCEVKYVDDVDDSGVPSLDYSVYFELNSHRSMWIKKVHFSSRKNMQYQVYDNSKEGFTLEQFKVLFDAFANSKYGRKEKLKKLMNGY